MEQTVKCPVALQMDALELRLKVNRIIEIANTPCDEVFSEHYRLGYERAMREVLDFLQPNHAISPKSDNAGDSK